MDLPALGNPTKPTSAKTLSSSNNCFSCPSNPGWAYLGVWFVEDLKCQLPSPPLPPGTTTFSSLSEIGSNKILPLSEWLANEFGAQYLTLIGDIPNTDCSIKIETIPLS